MKNTTMLLLIIAISLILISFSGAETIIQESSGTGKAIVEPKPPELSESVETEFNALIEKTAIQIPPIPTNVKINEYIEGLTVFRYKDGNGNIYHTYDDLSPLYYRPYHLSGISINAFQDGSAIISPGLGLGIDFDLLTVQDNEISTTYLSNSQQGSLPQLLSNGMVAVCDKTVGQRIKLLTPSGEQADIQLEFDYGKELAAHKEADFPFQYNTLGYERCAEAITYEDVHNRYIMIFTNSAWLEYEKDTSLTPCEIGVAIFDDQGKQTDLFMLETDEDFYISYISKGYHIYGASKLIYIGDNTVLLVGSEDRYCTIDLNAQQCQIITWDQVVAILNEHNMVASRAPHKITYKQPPCPLKLFNTSDEISIYTDDDEYITEFKGRYTPFGYAVDVNGACYIYFVNYRFETKEVQPALDDEQSHIVLNARFKFSVKIPNAWNAVDRSANGDGYFIECDNPNVDIRVYGMNEIFSPDYHSEELLLPFDFDNDRSGWFKENSDKSITFTYCSNDRTVEMYVGYEGEDDWLADNRETVFMVARTLHDTN